MKILLFAALLALSITARAQTVTNFQLRCIIALDNGLNITNTATTQNTIHYQSMTNAMVKLNEQRAVQNQSSVTNLSQFATEFFKQKITDFTNDYDAQLVFDMRKIPQMTQASKDIIRAELAKY